MNTPQHVPVYVMPAWLRAAMVYAVVIAVLALILGACGSLAVVSRGAIPVIAGTSVVLLTGGSALLAAAGASVIAWVATILYETSNAPPPSQAAPLPWFLNPAWWLVIYIVIRNHRHIIDGIKTVGTGGIKAGALHVLATIFGGKASEAAKTATLVHQQHREMMKGRRVTG